jgi:hypothetical protein
MAVGHHGARCAGGPQTEQHQRPTRDLVGLAEAEQDRFLGIVIRVRQVGVSRPATAFGKVKFTTSWCAFSTISKVAP